MKIAIFFAVWSTEYFDYISTGFRRYAQTHDVELHMFVCFGKQGREATNDLVEYAFLELPDVKEYDGAIVFEGTVMFETERKKWISELMKQLNAAKKPVVSVELPREGCSTVGIDQYNAMKELVKHMIEVHHARFLGYVGGIVHTYEAEVREKAFLDTVVEYNLETAEEWQFRMNYLYEDGIEVGRRVLEAYFRGDAVPDTMICANDEMAAGLCDILYETSLWGQVRVSGFDQYFNGERFIPTLTTVARPREQIAVESCKLMEELVSGKVSGTVKKNLDYRLVLGESCGCHRRPRMQERDMYLRKIFHSEQQLMQMDAILQKMEEQITNDSDGKLIGDSICKAAEKFGCMQCRVWFRENLLSEEPVTYRECTKEVANWQFGTQVPERKRMKIYVPLHFQQKIIGYFMFTGGEKMIECGMLESIMKKVSYIFENFIQKKRFALINKKYQKLYMTDQLTGLYNRFGLNELGQGMYQENIRARKDTVIIFCDINRLKYINDTFGHKAGDWAIRLVGDVLGEQQKENCMAFRFGGDEFVLIAEYRKDLKRVEQIQKLLAESQQQDPQEFHLDISIGAIVAPWRDAKELEYYLINADQIMYQEKKKYYQAHAGEIDRIPAKYQVPD